MKCLKDIWEENDRKPVMVYETNGLIREDSVLLIGIDLQYAYVADKNFNPHKVSAKESNWQVYEESKKLVPHWPALIKYNSNDLDRGDNGFYTITRRVYYCEEQASKHTCAEYKFIRLLKEEREPIMLEADEVKG